MIVELDGINHAINNAKRLVKVFENQVPKLIGQTVVRNVKIRITKSVDIDGKRLAPNSPITISNKGSSKPLIDKGVKRASVHYEIKGDKVVVGDSRAYGEIHQQGATIRPKSKSSLMVPIGKGLSHRDSPGYLKLKKVVIPARKVYPEKELGNEDMKAIEAGIQDLVKG